MICLFLPLIFQSSQRQQPYLGILVLFLTSHHSVKQEFAFINFATIKVLQGQTIKRFHFTLFVILLPSQHQQLLVGFCGVGIFSSVEVGLGQIFVRY